MSYQASIAEFREALLDRILSFLWRQWSALGVLGESGSEEEWVVDPESLLLFSLELGRYEPRLFDEILAWLQVNGHWLDSARMRRILREQDEGTARAIGGALQYVLSKGDKRKWQNLAAFCGSLHKRQPDADSLEPLFKDKTGKPHPLALPDKMDSNFSLFYINRPKIKNLKKAREVSINAHTNLRFLLRSLFGTGAKSESILYLLTHEGARPKEIGDAAGLSWLSVHQALLELSKSGLVLTRSKGKKIEYWLSQNKWWDFVAVSGYAPEKRPQWLNWMAIFSALSTLWKTVDEIASGTASDYMKSSKLQDSLEIVAQEFARAGYDISKAPATGLPPDLHQKMALRFLGELFELSEEERAAST